MPLAPGTRLGPYEIITALGEGGMGEVYRARDTRLGRDVALKVLPRDLLDDAQRLARFEREAQTLAALNHPHIATIHDVVESAGQRAIVMELLTGRTLEDIMAAGAMPSRAALGYAVEICDALSAAHAAGIVHRDLKPANVIVTDGGRVKVLDFGIAKVAVTDAGDEREPRTRTALTAGHVLVGTIGYMSPEQVQGRTVDARSDIFSLGVLLFEMLAGRRAFDADSAAGMLSAVLRDDPPPLRAAAPGVPRSAERVTTRCLQKDPRHRYQTALDLKIALEDAREDLTTPAGTDLANPVHPSAAVSSAAKPGRAGLDVLTRLGYVAGGAALGAAGLVAAGAFRPGIPLTPYYRPFITEARSATWPAWSPDGRTLAYVAEAEGTLQVFLRSLDAAQPIQLTRERWPVVSRPFWTPDGTRLYFVRNRELVSIGIAGGETQPVMKDAPENNAAATISPDGRTIALVRGEPGVYSIWTVDAGTGEVHRLERDGLPTPIRRVSEVAFSPDGTVLAAIVSHTAQGGARGVWLIPWPAGTPRLALAKAPYREVVQQRFGWMPDSRRIVFNASPLHESVNRLFLGDTATDAVHQLTAGANSESHPSVSPDGRRIAFVSTRAGMDLVELPVDGGPPRAVLQSSREESYPDISPSGVMTYLTDADGWPGIRMRAGSEAWSRSVGPERQEGTVLLQQVRLSPDGQRVAVDVFSDEHLIWIYPVAGGTPVRLDRESADQHGASWSPDGNWLAYRRLVKDKWELAKISVGGGAAVRLADADSGGVGTAGATDWSATGAWIAHRRADGVHLVSPDGQSTRVLAGPRPAAFRFSRDGARLFDVHRGDGRRWELSIWDVASGARSRVMSLPLAASADVEGLAFSPDESRIIVGAGTPTSDIWLLEQFEPPAAPWSQWFRGWMESGPASSR
jgi:Tol biopolymer transport system component/predicted Ser/Thr protein kinase